MKAASHEEIEHLWIPMSDGTRLAARAWLPESRPAPMCIEYIPYGKRWGTRERDELLHLPLAQRGIACLRVDVRGTGDSEGLLDDEYSEAEIRDGCEVVEWAARQPWCDGRVFLLGKSWGGFNALQIAARRPKSLAGVISVYASDDRYANDAHYMGGCLLNENQIWGAILFALSAEPPSPSLLGDGWRGAWMNRLEHAKPFVSRWLEHPTNDEYWRRGSVRHDYAAIQCPVFLVAGWNDPYRDGAMRLVRSLDVPTRLLLGPWAHHYPHERGVGHAVDFAALVAEWIEGHGRQDKTIWIGHEIEGEFRRFQARDLEECEWESIPLTGSGARACDSGTRTPIVVSSPLTVGSAAGAWCPFGPAGLAGDQRADDRRSIVIDGTPLGDSRTILGFPVVRLRLRSPDAATVSIRLNDVDPSGASRRVAYGLLAIPATDWRDVEVDLTATGHHFEAGHRLRLSISTSYWPTAWPTGAVHGMRPVEIDTSNASLAIPWLTQLGKPVGLPGIDQTALPDPGEPPTELLRQTEKVRRLERRTGLTPAGDIELHHYPDIDVATGFATRRTFRIADHDPLSARCHITTDARFRGDSFNLRVVTSTRLRADSCSFLLATRLIALEAGKSIFASRWDEVVSRERQ